MTLPPDLSDVPDEQHPERVGVAVGDLYPVTCPRIATREQMIAAATKVLAGRGRGRHRKPGSRDGWLCLAVSVLSGWAATLRVCLLLTVAGGVMVGVAAMTSPPVGFSVGTFMAVSSVVAAGAVKPRRRRLPQL
ncbi:MAG TPA: hypothetical protein VGL46_09230 [Pseudonocardiaceae bacterium]|jgi:hypothetical protein